MPMLCEIVTQERLVFSGQVDMVVADGADGRLGILPHHTPLLTTLKVGELVVKMGGQEQRYAVGGGVLEVRPDKVTVLADVAEYADEIDLARAEAARAKAEKLLAEGVKSTSTVDDYAELTRSLLRANVRIKIARRRSGYSGPDA